MEKTVLHVKNCIAEILNYLLFVMTETIIFEHFSAGIPYFFRQIILAVIPLFFYFIRLKVHRLWLFSLFHLIPLILILGAFDDSLVQKITFFSVALIQVLISLHIRIAVYTQPARSDYGVFAAIPVIAVVMGAILFFLSGHTGLIASVMVFLALYFIYHYLVNFLRYTDMSRRTAGNLSVKDILTIDFWLVLGFTFITVLLMAAVAGRNILADFGTWLFELLRQLIRRFALWLLNKLSFGAETPATLAPEAQEVVLPEPSGQGPNLLAEILERVFIVVSTIVTVGLAVLIICAAVMLIITAFKKRVRKKKAGSYEDEGDLIEKLGREKRTKTKEKRRRLFRTADEKIRQIFVAVISKRLKRSKEDNTRYLMPRSATAREYLAIFAGEEAAPASLLVALYEKARYARESCTGADVRAARKLAAQIDNE